MGRVALNRMADDAVDISPRRQQFVPLTILHLGNAGTATDGFDSMFTEAAQHAAENIGFAETLTPDLRDADFVPGQIVESALGPTAKAYDSFAGGGTSILGEVGAGANGNGASGGNASPTAAQIKAEKADVVKFPAWKDPYGISEEGGSLGGRF